MKKNVTLSIVGLAVSVWGLAANAAPITLQYSGFVDGLSRSGSIQGANVLGGGSAGVAAGQFNFNVVTDSEGVYWDQTLQAFCIDTAQALVTGRQVTYDLLGANESNVLSDGQLSLISHLYDRAYGSLGTSLNNAAFQLALWEIMNEGSSASNLLDGSFRSSNFISSWNSSRTTANTWLSGLSTDYQSSRFEFFVLEAITPIRNQELLVVREVSVPEPGPLGLLGASLLAVGFARRWRSKQQ